MNQFASLYRTDAYLQTVADAIAIMRFCAETDPQAKRVLEIMEKFAKVVARWTKDHTYEAPDLAGDLSGLYSQMASPHLSQEPSGPLPGVLSPGDPDGQHILSAIQPTTLPGPAVPLPPLSELLIHHASSAGDTRMNGISPLHTSGPTLQPPLETRPPNASAHSIVDQGDPMNEDIEFDFDGLWNNWINHVVPVSTIAPGVAPLPPQFSPTATTPATAVAADTYGGFTMPPESRISPAAIISGTIPLYHTTNFG